MAKSRRRRPSELTDADYTLLLKHIKIFLKHPCWMGELSPKEVYVRIHDDTDGTNQGRLMVQFSPDGDAWVNYEAPHLGHTLRFRQQFAGGKSPCTKAALMILALAMQMDEKVFPQQPPEVSNEPKPSKG